MNVIFNIQVYASLLHVRSYSEHVCLWVSIYGTHNNLCMFVQGIAVNMLRRYIEHVKTTEPGVDKLLLICKAHLIPLYSKAGFTLFGPSDVVHGTLRVVFTSCDISA